MTVRSWFCDTFTPNYAFDGWLCPPPEPKPPTLIVAANGYTRDEVSLRIHGRPRINDGKPVPVPTVVTWPLRKGNIRFVTDNDLDDGVFQVRDARLD